MAETLDQTVRAAFTAAFGGTPEVVARAPGRVELLGNHTDYNGGLVLASAIDRFTLVAGRPIAGRVARVRSLGFDGEAVFLIDALQRGEPGSWGRYVRGVVWAMQEKYGELLSGFEAIIAGDVPRGAGLSSSASLEAALGMFLVGAELVPESKHLLNPDDSGRMVLAQTLRRAENDFVGVASGLLDQFTSLFGRADHAVWLDCRSLEHGRLPLGAPAPAIIVCDSKTSRRLADGMYNERRQECERVVHFFQQRELGGPGIRRSPTVGACPGVTCLRDISGEQLKSSWEHLDPIGRLRARHVMTENERVRQGGEGLRAGDLEAFGRLMSASHASSRDDFENSSPALDALIAAARVAPGFLGGKLSGAGWAGCTVNLVRADYAAAFAAAVRSGYARRTGIDPEIHVCRAAEGASAMVLA